MLPTILQKVILMSRQVFNMDFGWRFHRGDLDIQAGTTHADSYQSCKSGAADSGAAKEFADADWRLVDLPHDYIAESEMGPEHLHSNGYRKRDNAWYRKSFKLDESLKDKALTLCFEGTATAATFYFNGSLMARTHSAYTEPSLTSPIVPILTADRMYSPCTSTALSRRAGGMRDRVSIAM